MRKKRTIIVAMLIGVIMTLLLCACSASRGEQGPKGEKGEPGAQGLQGVPGDAGADGKTAEYRSHGGWVQWKYTDEGNTAWRNLYEYSPTVIDPDDSIPEGIPTALITTEALDDNYGLAGSYSKFNQKEVVVGESVTLTATVNEGYNFEGWYLKDGYRAELLSSEPNYEYTMTNYDVTIVAKYSAYTISVQSSTDDEGLAGSYTMLNQQKKAAGSELELIATVNEGYNFEGWYLNDVCLSRALNYTYQMGKESVSIEARFSAFTVTTVTEQNVADSAGSYTKMNHKKIAVGERIPLAATVNEGYNFEGWFIDGVCVSRNLNYTYTMEREDIQFCAVYSSYTLTTIGTEENAYGDLQEGFAAGQYTAYANEKVSAGQTVTLTATVNEGYNFTGWFVDGICVSTDLSYEFTMRKENVIVVAGYSYYCLTTNAMDVSFRYEWHDFENASLYINAVYTDEKISVGQAVTVTAYDIQGYRFVGWHSGDSVLLSTDQTFTFEMPSDNMTLKAWYVEEE